MTKNHFIALADMIKYSVESGYCEKFTDNQLNELASFCQKQNPNFKRDRWLDYIDGACGKNGGKVKQAA